MASAVGLGSGGELGDADGANDANDGRADGGRSVLGSRTDATGWAARVGRGVGAGVGVGIGVGVGVGVGAGVGVGVGVGAALSPTVIVPVARLPSSL